ncbi:MAG: hypothetical protein PHR35_15095 [Kiritimatiellae bacterium]|nr:hypothetical protein [Kiritimatiellia bacterium]
MDNNHNRLSRRLIRLGLALLALAALLWLLHIPERKDRVFRAMPENSLMVSEHLDLAKVWRERLDNPMVLDAMSGAGMREAPDWMSDTNIVWIVRLVSGPRSLIGWSPALGPSGSPCWTAASWVGLRGRLLNLMLLTRWIPGVGRLQTTPSGVRYLKLKSKKTRGLKLAFALRENVLMSTLGVDPDSVRTLEWRFVNDAPLAPLFRCDPQPWKRTGSMPHRAWVDPAISPVPLPADGPLEVGLREAGREHLDMIVRWPSKHGATAPASEAAALAGRCTAATALAGNSASGLLMLPYTTAQRLAQRHLPGVRLYEPSARADEREDVCLYLCSQPYGGRLFNLAVPSLTLLLPWADVTDPARTAANLVIQLNAALDVNLTTRVPDPPVAGRTLISWLGGGRRRQWLSDDACMAAEWHPGWMTLCSSAASLDAQRRADADAPGAWRDGLTARLSGAAPGTLHGYLWLDLHAAAYELTQLLSVLRIATALGAVRTNADEAALVDALNDAAGVLNRFGTLEVAWKTGDNAETLELALTAASRKNVQR